MKTKLAIHGFAVTAIAIGVASAIAQDIPAQAPSPKPPLEVSDPTFSVRPARVFRSDANFDFVTENLATYPAGQGRGLDPLNRQQGAAEVQLTSRSHDLIRKLEATDSDSKRKEIKNELGEVLSKQFDLRQTRHNHEIELLEAQIKKLKELVQRRQENREEIIARRLDQLIRDSQGLGF